MARDRRRACPERRLDIDLAQNAEALGGELRGVPRLDEVLVHLGEDRLLTGDGDETRYLVLAGERAKLERWC